MSYDLNKLVGIPFKLNGRDFNGCDCMGIAYLYYRYVKDIIYSFSDGKRTFLRNPKKDFERIVSILEIFAHPVLFSELDEGDIVVLKSRRKTVGAVGVCINKHQILHMDKFVGSCLTKIRYLKNFFLTAYRPK